MKLAIAVIYYIENMKKLAFKNRGDVKQNDINNGAVKYLTVPGDVLIDVLLILHTNKLRYEIRQVNGRENNILLYLSSAGQPAVFHHGLENIETILKDYDYYVNGIPGQGLTYNDVFDKRKED